MTMRPHDRIPLGRHLQLRESERFGNGMTVFDTSGRLPSHSAVLFVPPTAEMFTRTSPLRRLSSAVRQRLGDDTVTPPFGRLLASLRRQMAEYPAARYVIVFGKTDQEWRREYERLLPLNAVAVFANNVRFSSFRSVPYPMGRDWRLAGHTYGKAARASCALPREKTIDCYANFGIDTHFSRRRLARLCRLNSTIHTADLGGRHLDYRIGYGTFLERLASSHYCICPRGAGLDTYRFWDCLYMGVTPVVFDAAIYDIMPCPAPCLVIAPARLASIDFRRLAEEMSDSVADFDTLCTTLDAEYWRTMVFETLRLGRPPAMQEVIAAMASAD